MNPDEGRLGEGRYVRLKLGFGISYRFYCPLKLLAIIIILLLDC